MNNNLDRRAVLRGGAIAGAAGVAALANPTSANAAIIYTWGNHQISENEFWIEVYPKIDYAYLAITGTVDGVNRSAKIYNNTWYSGWLPKWRNVQARYIDRRGRVLTTSPILNPTVTPKPSTSTVPAPAAAAGMSKLLLNSNFTDLSRIDMGMSGKPGFDWYTNYIWNSSQQQTPSKTLSIGTDTDGSKYLKITPDNSNCNWTISTFDQKTQAGAAYTYGYFQSTVRFAQSSNTIDWGQPADWPSIWLASVRGMKNIHSAKNGEIDILEALAGYNKWTGALHEWPGYWEDANNNLHHYSVGKEQEINLNNDWHTFAALWERPNNAQEVKVTWFVDGVEVFTRKVSPYIEVYTYQDAKGHITASDTPVTGRDQWGGFSYGSWQELSKLPTGVLSCLKEDMMTLVLGTGKTRPMDVKNVQIWGY